MPRTKPLRWYDLSFTQKRFASNGCGPAGWKVLKVFKPLLKDLEESCNQHDWHYLRGKDEEDRLLADRAFYRHMRREIAKLAWWKKPGLHLLAVSFYQLVLRRGEGYFSYREHYLEYCGTR